MTTTLCSVLSVLALVASASSTPLNKRDADGAVGSLIPDKWLDAINKGVPGLQALNSLFQSEIENDTLRHLNETVAKDITTLTTKLGQVEGKIDQVLPVVNILTNLATDVKREMSTRFYKVEARLGGVESKLTSLDSKVTVIDSKISGLDSKVTGMESIVTQLESTVSKGHEFLKEKIDKMEASLTGLESTVSKGHEFLKEKIDKVEESLTIITNWIKTHNKTISTPPNPDPVTSNHVQRG